MSDTANKFIVKYRPSLTVQDNWENAIPISEAWLIFLDDDELRLQYENARTFGATHFAESLIKGALADRVFSADLLAIGIPESDVKSDATPRLLPSNMFRQGVSRIDWDSGTVEGLGHIYHAVHISCAAEEPPAQTADRLSFTSITTGEPNAPTPEPHSPKPRGGRPSGYDKSASVLTALYEKEANRSLSPERLLGTFKAEFARQFPYTDYKTPPPALRTLREHMKRFRQEAAETGRN